MESIFVSCATASALSIHPSFSASLGVSFSNFFFLHFLKLYTNRIKMHPQRNWLIFTPKKVSALPCRKAALTSQQER